MLTGFTHKGSPVHVTFEHYRVFPSLCGQLKSKGLPDESDLERYHKGDGGCAKPWARGGKTIAILYTPGGCSGKYEIARGEAICSMADQFDYDKGRNLALERAMEDWFAFKRLIRTIESL